MKRISKYVAFILTIFISSAVFAQLASEEGQAASVASTENFSCNEGNANNIGMHIVNWIFCGVESVEQTSMLGTLLHTLGIACLFMAFAVLGRVAFNFIYVTGARTNYQGDDSRLAGGFYILKTTIALFFLIPMFGGGFSLAHLAAYKATKWSVLVADETSVEAAEFLSNEGGFFKVDLQNVEDLSKYILLAEVCSIATNIYAEVPLEDAKLESNSAIKLTRRASGDGITLNWDYHYRQVNQFKAKYQSRFVDESEDNYCGQITVKIPTQITRRANASSEDILASFDGNTLTLDSSISYLRPYADIYTRQFQAVLTHRDNIRSIITPLFYDLEEYASISSLKAQLALTPTDEDLKTLIQKTYENADFLADTTSETYQHAVNAIAQETDRYRREIETIGLDAASAVTEVDGVTQYSCPENDGLFSTCRENKTWVEEISDSGFVAFPTYYWIMNKHNQKIIDLQSHFSQPSEQVPSIFDPENNVTKKITTMGSVDTTVKRGLATFSALNNAIVDKSFTIDQSVLQNQDQSGGNAKESSSLSGASSIYDSVRTTLNGFLGKLTQSFTNVLVDNTGRADLLVKLITMGSLFQTIGYGILIALLLLKVASLLIGVFGKGASLLAKGADSFIGGNDDDGIGGFLGKAIKLAFYLAIGLIGIGLMLQFVIPAIPIIKWGAEILRWAITIFTFIILIPIFILSHILTTDERIMNEQTRAGWGTILEICLRPYVLIVSFIGIFILMHITDIIVIFTSNFLTSMLKESSFNVVAMILIMAMLVFIAVHGVLRTFDLITNMADNIFQKINLGGSTIAPDTDGGSGRLAAMAVIASKMSVQPILGSVTQKK